MFNPYKPKSSASSGLDAWWRSDEISAPRAEDFSDNARAVDALLRYTTNGDHPRWIAEAIMSGDDDATTKLADLARQLDARQLGRGQAYVDDVMQQIVSQAEQDFANMPLPLPDNKYPAPNERPPVWGRWVPEDEDQTDNRINFRTANSSDGDKKTGQYIWRTVGDSKVRSAHAERDGQTFSWDSPPDGGHPGEAPNCRCQAEDVNLESCKHLQAQLEVDQANAAAASERWNSANNRYNEILAKLKAYISDLDDAYLLGVAESAPVVGGLIRLGQGKKINPGDLVGPISTAREIRKLKKQVDLLQKEYDEALVERDALHKDLSEAKARATSTRNKIVKQGCRG